MSLPYPTYARYRQGRIIAGVASGLACHLGVNVFLVRMILMLASLFGGVSVLFYALVWISSQLKDAPEGYVAPQQPRRLDSLVLVPIGILGAVASVSLVTGFQGNLLLALVALALGAGLSWLAMDWGLDGLKSLRGLVMVAAGVFLLGSGVLLALLHWDNPGVFMASAVSVVLTLAGVLILGLPLWLRLWDALMEAEADRRAEAERAEIAAQLHDSVLQTLALIQKQAHDPQTVSLLARRQERQLRQWLFDSEQDDCATTFAALGKACGEVEDLFGLHIVPVTVGVDLPLTQKTQAAVLAAREAMVNAAKHAGVSQVDVYAETLDGLDIFVRDRGLGFDVSAIPEDRHGVRDSIMGRTQRVGGVAEIRSSDNGTEVHIRVPVENTVS